MSLDAHADVPKRAPTRTWWWLPGVWLLVAVLPYPFVPERVQEGVYLATGGGTVLALLAGSWLFRPAVPAAWRLLTAAVGFSVLGDLLASVHLDAGGMPTGPWSDLSDLAFYPLTLLALLLLLRHSSDRDASAWLDAVIWTVGASLVAWESVLEGSSLVERPSVVNVITVAYPSMDLVLLLVLLRLLFGAIRDNRALLLLGVGLGVRLVTETLHLTSSLGAGYDGGHLLELGWLFTYCAMAAAALHPSTTEPVLMDGGRHGARLGAWRIPLLLIPALAAPTMLALLTVTDSLTVERDDVAVATTSTGVVLVLIALRGSGLVRLANRRAEDLRTHVDHDTLTGLLSRDGFFERLTAALADPSAQPGEWSVILLDLDDFKIINDIQGHSAGDRLLGEVGRRVRSAAPPDAVVARVGGDEFALLVPTAGVETVVERVLAAIEQQVVLDSRDVRPTVSIGSAVAVPGLSAEELLRCVDVAMYDAKRSGRSWARYDPRMSLQLSTARDTRERLASAVADGEVVPWFQPVVDLGTGALHGFEALARWVAPDQGPVTPADQWLPLAEESDLIVAVDRHVIDAAIRQLARCRELFAADELTMAVNVSGRTLHRSGIEAEILDLLHQHGVPCDRLVVEITEGTHIQDEQVGPRLQRLRRQGVRIALDDFGTGWSSLSYLRRFPVDILKLDRSFTNDLGTSADATAIPAAVVQLAAALGLGIIAEGVETQLQRTALLRLGFSLAQGYLYSAAIPAADVDDRLFRCDPHVAGPRILSPSPHPEDPGPALLHLP